MMDNLVTVILAAFLIFLGGLGGHFVGTMSMTTVHVPYSIEVPTYIPVPHKVEIEVCKGA